jgi:2-polyprenyl-6-methoxyphenol hydroxylase-like FAD-dependent oxidoreductase
LALANNSKQILVVGAGPTGLTLACELARHGLSCRIVEKAKLPSDKSRALAIHARTLEVLDQMGACYPFLEVGNKIHTVNLYEGGEQIVHFTLDAVQSYFNFSLVCPQSLTEKFLTEHLGSFGIEVERDVELTNLSQEGSTVYATLNKAGQETETSAYDYVIGCDGAHSAVRRCLGLQFKGITISETFLLADVSLTPDPPLSEINLFVTNHGIFGIFPIKPNCYRVIVNLEEGADAESPTLSEIQGFINNRCPFKLTATDPEWLAAFHINSREVSTFSVGNVFLAGDAAHIHSPAGGQGMNTGMQDAYNLAWKLALVVKGYAAASLLASYSIERQPVAAKVLQSTEALTKLNISSQPIIREMRKHIVPMLTHLEFVQEHLRNELSELSVAYKQSPIIGEYHKPPSIFSLSGTTPSASAWMEFSVGPHPGERAPDNICYADNVDTRIFQVIKGTKHNLFLFTGNSVSNKEFETLKEIATIVKANYSHVITTHLVLAGEIAPEELKMVDFADSVLTDPDLSMHQSWGADFASLYLLRPDTYVGYRSQPPDWNHLRQYLERVFLLVNAKSTNEVKP